MPNKNQLKCPICSSILHLQISFDGCDWKTVAGEDSKYEFPVSLVCKNERCANIYTLGRLNNEFAFSEVTEEQRPYEGRMND